MSNDTEERRRYSRVPFDSKATIIGEKAQWQTQLIDISLKGALVERPETWDGDIDDQFTVELVLGDGDTTINMNVIVARVENDVIGFYCKNIDYDSIVHLKRLMQINLGDAELVNRELSSLGT